MYDGNIKFSNLWLNEERIDSLLLKYVVLDKDFTFKTEDNNKLKLSGNILFNKYPKITFGPLIQISPSSPYGTSICVPT